MATQISAGWGSRGRWLSAGLAVLLAAAAMAEPARAQTPSRAAPGSISSGSYLNLQPYLAVPPFDVKAFPRRRAEPRPPVLAPLRADRNAAVDAPRPRVVCGMTIVPGNPAVDPGITARMTPPDSRPVMRTIVPSLCGEMRQP